MRRKTGGGSLVSKGRGKPFMARWVYDGKIYTRSTGKTNRREALKVLAEFVRPYQERSEVGVQQQLLARLNTAVALQSDDPHAKGIRIKDVFFDFENDLTTSEITKGTCNLYKGYWTGFCDFLKRKHPDVDTMRKVTVEMAREYLGELKDEVSSQVYNFKLLFLRRLWKMLGKKALCSSNVWQDFPKRKVPKGSSRRPLREEELKAIFDHVKPDPQITLLFCLGIYTGLRKGDCVHLKWSNVDFANREIAIVPQKTKRHLSSPIHIPMHDVLYRLLKARRSEVDAEDGDKTYVLPELVKSDWNKIIDRVFAECGIETHVTDENGRMKITTGFHALRHTFVSMNINGGVSPFVIQALVGHSTTDMTRAYYHESKKAAERGIAKLPSFVKVADDGSVESVPMGRKELAVDADVYEAIMRNVGSGDVSEYLRRLVSGDEKKMTGGIDRMKAVA